MVLYASSNPRILHSCPIESRMAAKLQRSRARPPHVEEATPRPSRVVEVARPSPILDLVKAPAEPAASPGDERHLIAPTHA
jgi:hypothetical protein